MADFLGIVSRSDVTDVKTFCTYAHQKLGVPPCQIAKLPALRRLVKDFFAAYPGADYQTLTKVIDFAQNRKLRPRDMLALVALYRSAWAAGYLPECDPTTYHDPELEKALENALTLEEHPRWIERLKQALWFYNDQQRREVYDSWKQDRIAAGLKVV